MVYEGKSIIKKLISLLAIILVISSCGLSCNNFSEGDIVIAIEDGQKGIITEVDYSNNEVFVRFCSNCPKIIMRPFEIKHYKKGGSN